MKLKQRGQTIVEFALVIPLFVFILMGIMAFALYFSDYIALNNIARSVAREAALLTNDEDGEYWNEIIDRYVSNVPETSNPATYYLPNSAYTWDPSTMTIAASGTKDVKVTLTANVSDGGPVKALANIMGDDSFLNSINVEYIMYWEKQPTDTSTD